MPMLKRLILGVSALALVGGVAAGLTGAYFTSTAESQGNTFTSGSLNLLIDLEESSKSGFNESYSGSETPGFSGLTPGGDPANLSSALENDGDADAAGIGISVNHTTNENGIAEQMRISQLDWKGENLLKGAAGAELSDYDGPSESECDVIVDGDADGDPEKATIQGGVDDATSGDQVCVRNGTYGESVTIDTSSVTLSSLNGKSNTTIDSSSGTTNVVKIPAGTNGVTVEGFTLTGADRRGVFVGDFSNGADTTTTITDNTISGIGQNNNLASGDEVHGILVETGGDNSVIRNNLIEDLSDGDSTRAVGVSLVSQDSDALESVTVENNIIRDITTNASSDDTKAKGVELSGNVTGATLNENTINGIGNADTNKPRGIAIIETDISGSAVGPTDFSITANVIDDITANLPGSGTYEGEAGVFVGSYADLDGSGDHGLHQNEFLGGFVRNCCGSSEPTLDATQNWWGQPTGPETEQVSSAVDTSDYLGGPHNGFVNGTDNNGNGFADLADLAADPIENASPGLDAGATGQLDFLVELDGPSTDNSYQDSQLTSDFTYTLGQVNQ